MVNTQSVYDLEYVYGEFGDNYSILIKNDDGSDADISGFDGAKLTIKKPDGTELVAINVSDSPSYLTITSPNVVWAMKEAHTTAESYDGKVKIQVQLTNSTTKKRLTKIYTGFIYKNQS